MPTVFLTHSPDMLANYYGVRALAGPAFLRFTHMNAAGEVLEMVDRFAEGDVTMMFSLQDLFTQPIAPGDRITASYSSFDLFGIEGQRWPGAKGALLFLTETGNLFNNPNVVYREPLNSSRYANGFDPFLVK